MCGIAGIVTSADARLGDLQAVLETMAGAMVHRGPDDNGTYVSTDGLLGLANRRLAIQDLSPAGHMPMASPDGMCWITYNGEIYNTPELRHELQSRGCVFRSQSDTEVILNGYRLWGRDVVQRLRGMFAFAIHDARKRRLLLARDPLGIKPLYYAAQAGRFAFASECKTLLRAGAAQASVRSAGLVTYLALGSVPAPLTIYRGIDALQAGHTLQVDLSSGAPLASEPQAYWSLPSGRVEPMNYSEAVERTHELLLDSVRRHLVSDVPLGAFLSGGIDSGSIVALMREASPSAVIRTCSVTFAESEFDEGPLARQVAAAFGAEHVDVPITAGDVSGELDRVLDFLDQPSNDGINTYFVSRAARQAGLTVALSGVGGDELFGGYPTFTRLSRVLLADTLASRVPAAKAILCALLATPGPRGPSTRLADWLAVANGSATAAYFGLRGLFSPRIVRRLVAPDILADARAALGRQFLAPVSEQRSPEGDAWDIASRLELTSYMGHQLLRDSDAMSMAHSLELRVPFVDSRLIEAVLSMPVSVRRGKPLKRLLRDAVPALPSVIRDRRTKQGFTFPFGPWMRGPLREQVRALAAEAVDGLGDALDHRAAAAVLEAFNRGESHWSQPWAIASLATVNRASLASASARTAQPVQIRGAQSVATTPANLGRVLAVFPTTELIGGIQTSGRTAWQALAPADNGYKQNTMFCYCADGAASPDESIHGEIHAGTKGLALYSTLRRRWAADSVLFWHVGLIKLLPFLRLPSARTFVYLHGIEVWTPLDPITRALLKRVDLILSNSDYTWERFVSIDPSFAAVAHKTVPLGWGNALLNPPPPPLGAPAAVMVARLEGGERYKGHAEVIDVWPLVRQRTPGAQLWIVGDGQLRHEFEQRVRDLGLTGCIHFFGTVSEERKRELIEASRCLVLPSRKEGFGLVYLEAMRLGRPCLVSDADAGREVVNPPVAGLAADVADPVALAESISRLLSDGAEWQSWSIAAAERYASMFTAAQFQARLISTLASLRI